MGRLCRAQPQAAWVTVAESAGLFERHRAIRRQWLAVADGVAPAPVTRRRRVHGDQYGGADEWQKPRWIDQRGLTETNRGEMIRCCKIRVTYGQMLYPTAANRH